ncbi:acyl-CoA dehydrogenase family protein [Nocardia sp. NPDC056000]|uniref:acyl-CoA dehydrogenase family protein n=1 Tax=Nocardia sp. NPDC056000 TaxID=3345674 RepID=UPI0035D68E22
MTAVVETTAVETVAAELYSAAAELDATLGDTDDPHNACGFAAMITRAESGRFPDALSEAVGPLLRLAYVPESAGGELVRYDETYALVRVAARRDLTLMPATMIDITAATCVLLAGSEAQRRWVVDLLRRGRSIGFAFSEPEHGSDLLANTCALTRSGDHWRLDGVKWLVGFGREVEAALVIAHTGGRGPAAFSAVILADPLDVPSRTTEPGASIRFQRVAGMCGARYAEFHFDDIPVEADALVGPLGRGMETAMKAMQIVRATSTAANLAGADSALRLTLDFARGHLVANRPVDNHAPNRRELGTAAAALIAADAAALGCVRAMHTFPEVQSLWSGTLKTVLTGLSEEVFTRCADVLGTRSVLREGAAGAFDVLRADNAAVRFFDTSPMANLRLVSMQLNCFADPRPAPDDRELLAATFDLGRELPPFDLGRFTLSARRDVVIGALSGVLAEMRAVLEPTALDRGILEGDATQLLEELELLELEVRSAVADIRRLGELPPVQRGVAQLDLARRISYLTAAASCVHLWWFNRDRSLYRCPPGAVGWLTAAVALLLDRSCERTARLPIPLAGTAFAVVSRLSQERRLFSAVPIPLAGPHADPVREKGHPLS